MMATTYRSAGGGDGVTDLHLPRTPIGPLRSALLTLGGTNRAVLDKCPTETEARTALGVAVLVPTVMAAVGTTVALANLGTHPLGVAVGAVFVAGVVLAVDRLMVTAPTTRLSVGLRAVMTLAMAWLVGEQLLVAAFRSEVDAELDVMHAAEITARTETITAETDAELARIDTRLAVLLADDPDQLDAVTRLDAAEAELAAARAQLEELRVQLREEISGTGAAGSTGRAGDGPVAEALRAEIDLAAIAVDEATGARDRAAAALNDTTARSEIGAGLVAGEIEALTERRAQVEADRLDAVADAEAQVVARSGIIARVEALERLAASPLMAAQIWALRIVLLVIDTLPLTVKLAVARRSSSYEQLTDAYQHLARQRAAAIRRHRPDQPHHVVDNGRAARRPRALVGGKVVPIGQTRRSTSLPTVDEELGSGGEYVQGQLEGLEAA